MFKFYRVNVYAVQVDKDISANENVVGTVVVNKKLFSAKEIKYNRYIHVYDDLAKSEFSTQQTFSLNEIKLYGRSIFIKKSDLVEKNKATISDIFSYLEEDFTCIEHEISIDRKNKKQNVKVKR